jgi:hypothetical protein
VRKAGASLLFVLTDNSCLADCRVLHPVQMFHSRFHKTTTAIERTTRVDLVTNIDTFKREFDLKKELVVLA